MKRQHVPTSKKPHDTKPPEGTSDYAKKVRSGKTMYRGNQMNCGPSCCAHDFDVRAFYRRRDEREEREARAAHQQAA